MTSGKNWADFDFSNNNYKIFNPLYRGSYEDSVTALEKLNK